MNILFLSPVVPNPPVDGDRQRAHFLLRALAQKHRVHVCCFCRSHREIENLENLKSFCSGVTGVPISSGQIRWNSLKAWTGPLPLNVAAFESRTMRRAIAGLARTQAFDAVHAYRLRMAPYALDVNVPFRILDYTDALSRYFQTRLEQPALFWKKKYLRREARQLAVYEPGISRKFDVCLISSPTDQKFLLNLGAGKNLEVVTNGVDTRQWRPAAKTSQGKIVLFTGNMRYPPNAEGMESFCRETWPRVLAAEPGARLFIAGITPQGASTQWQRRFPGAEFLGRVPDLQPYYGQASVAVCPLAVASGRQFKVIEAFAAGVPVVTTGIVAKNLDARPGQELLTADTPELAAGEILRVLRNPKLAEGLRSRARAFAVKQYDHAQVARALWTVYNRLEAKLRTQRAQVRKRVDG